MVLQSERFSEADMIYDALKVSMENFLHRHGLSPVPPVTDYLKQALLHIFQSCFVFDPPELRLLAQTNSQS